MERTITVKGVGRASAKADLVVIEIDLNTIEKSYEKSMQLSAEKIIALSNSLASVGFDKKDIKTTDFDVSPSYKNVKKNGEYESIFVGYKCTQSVKITFDFDTKRLGCILDSISKSIVNPDLSIDFTVKDPSAVSDELLRSATANARKKAEILCEASNSKLGDLISINYNWGEINLYSNTKLMDNCICGDMSNVDFEPEEISATDTVTFVWEIK